LIVGRLLGQEDAVVLEQAGQRKINQTADGDAIVGMMLDERPTLIGLVLFRLYFHRWLVSLQRHKVLVI
jgi:hypothetical protein